jgi:hypothetical protein
MCEMLLMFEVLDEDQEGRPSPMTCVAFRQAH